MLITDSAVIPEVATVDGVYLHTACTGGEGKDNTAAGDVSSVVGMFGWRMDHVDHLGGDQLFASSTYAIALTLGQVTSSSAVGTGNVDGGYEPCNIMYDASGPTRGPAGGTGTVYVTISSPASGTNYTAFASMVVTLEIEPLP